MDRPLVRSTETKQTPLPTDMVARELAYSFLSETLFVKYPTGEIKPIGGYKLVSDVDLINKAPDTVNDTASVQDSVGVITGNVLSNDSDSDGDTFTVSQISYNSITRVVGTPFTTQYGTFNIQASGAWTFTVGATGHALTVGQSATEVFSYRATDSRMGTSKVTTLTISLVGSNEGPLVSGDAGVVPLNTAVSGNVLSNDSDYEGNPLTVTSFFYQGAPSSFAPGDTATMAGVGTITMSSAGAWTFTPVQDYSGLIPNITYVVSDGTSSNTGTLSLIMQQPAASYTETVNWFNSYDSVSPQNIATNPPPARANPTDIGASLNATYDAWDYVLPLPTRIGATSTSLDFRVGPGKEYEEPHDVPWDRLLPGDRVFIYHRAQPYKQCIHLYVRGDATKWIEVIGVKGPNGELPVFSGQGAVDDPTTKSNEYMNSHGAIYVRYPIGGSSTYKPAYIHIHGIEFRDFNSQYTFTNYLGAQATWGDFACGVYFQGVDHITISGCKFVNNGLGIFGISTPALGERLMSRYIHVLFNHFQENGVYWTTHGTFGTHNAYTEGAFAIYEFNYFDKNRAGNAGDSLKERSSGQVFRYNKFNTGAANAIAIRDPEASYAATSGLQDKYGKVMYDYVYVYGNEFALTNSANAIGHGDGLNSINNEIRGNNGTVFFYNNRVICKWDNSSGYAFGEQYNPVPFTLFTPMNVRSPVNLKAQNNLFYSERATPSGAIPDLAIYYWQGTGQFNDNIAHNVRPVFLSATAIPSGDSQLARGTRSTQTMIDLNLVNTNADQGFLDFANNDFTLDVSAPFRSLAGAPYADAVQRGLIPNGDPVAFPLNKVPAPVIKELPSLSGSIVVGNVLTVVPGKYSPLPSSRTYQFYRDGVSIAGATGTTYTTVLADEQTTITVRETAINEVGSTVATSLGLVVISATTPQVVTPPAISGSLQVTFPLEVSNGTWTVAPVSYTYQWKTADGNEISGATFNGFTPGVSRIGQQVFCTVGAVSAGGETGYANSNVVTLVAVNTDPDVNGVFNFDAPNGTMIKDLNSGWKGKDSTYYGFTNEMYQTLNGTLVVTANYASSNFAPVWYESGTQNDNQSVGLVFDLPATGSGVGFAIEVNAAQSGYMVVVGPTTFRMSKNGADMWFVGSVTHNLPATNARMKMTKVGNLITVYGHSNETLATFTDDGSFAGAILSGGWPGLAMSVQSLANNTTAAIKSWTATPSW